MMSVEPRTNAAVVVDRATAHGAGRAAGADDDGGVGGKCLHLGEARLEMTGSPLIAFIPKLAKRDFERLLVLAVSERHEADSPPGGDRLLERHVGQTAGGRHWHAREDFLQPLRQ